MAPGPGAISYLPRGTGHRSEKKREKPTKNTITGRGKIRECRPPCGRPTDPQSHRRGEAGGPRTCIQYEFPTPSPLPAPLSTRGLKTLCQKCGQSCCLRKKLIFVVIFATLCVRCSCSVIVFRVFLPGTRGPSKVVPLQSPRKTSLNFPSNDRHFRKTGTFCSFPSGMSNATYFIFPSSRFNRTMSASGSEYGGLLTTHRPSALIAGR